ncbi:hypothetical protein ES703_32938 [subsurface metagenome]
MKLISWQLVVIIAIVVGSITAIELYALSQGIDGGILALVVASIVGIPSVIITRKISKPKVK